MSTTLVTDIGELTTHDPERARLVDAALVLDDGLVAWVGEAAAAPAADTAVSVGGRAVLPGWVDSHSHLVFAGERSAEFEARMAGHAYAAGGIATTVAATRAAGEVELDAGVARLRAAALRGGTTWMETKTGYALDVEGEVRSAVIAGRHAEDVTFLGAHLVPPGASAEDYLALVTGPMLTAVAPLVSWVDVFCERGAFDADASRAVLEAGRAAGLGLRVHGNQLGPGPGVALAVELGAASVDHCNHLTGADVEALASSATVAALLPATDLSTRVPLAPGRALLDAGASVALASNCNPGTSYTTSMAFAVATAVLQMHLTVEEAVRAATHGGALALRRAHGEGRVGSLGVGARADLHVLDAPRAAHLAYRPGEHLTWAVWRGGEKVVG